MERTYISLNPANIITISIAALLGYGLLVGSAKLYDKLRMRNGSQ